MAKELNSLRHLERDYLRNIATISREPEQNKIIYRGVVTFVDRIGSTYRTRFSIKAKIFGIDDFDDNKIENDKFFPPLLPIWLMSIPEVGEEIIIICEEIGNLGTGYWISRVNLFNKLTKIEAGEILEEQGFDTDSQTIADKRGTVAKLKEEIDTDEPDKNYDIPVPRIKPGDTIIQGRSNTLTKYTFDTKNLKGLIEQITEELEIDDEKFYKEEFRKSKGARIVQATLSDLDSLIIDKLYELKFHENFLKGETGDGINENDRAKNKYETAYLLLEAIEFRFLSRLGNKVCHAVLAEPLELWLIKIINLIKILIDDIETFRNNVDTLREKVSTHKHMATGPTSPPLPPELTVFAAELKTSLETDKSNFKTDKENIEKHKKPIPEHHSKVIALN